MKKTAIWMFLALLLSVPAMANTDAYRQEFGAGVGADVTVYKSENPYFESVSVETSYDIANRETRIFAVAHVDLADKIKSLI